MASMDRLVELFIQSARYGENGEPGPLTGLPQDGGHLDAEGIERGLEAIWKMLTTEDGLRMGLDPSATYVCLGMALEEKPLLQAGAARCYEKTLELLDALRKRRRESGGSWERCVVLQQLGTVCIRQGKPKDGARWLEESLTECSQCEGHPRDATLFGGAFNTKQTRLDFVGTVEKFAAKAYHDMGDQVKAKQHYEEVQRLSRLQSCDAVERIQEQGASQQSTVVPGGAGASKPSTIAPQDGPKVLWAATQAEEHRLSEYRFVDEGPTVLLMWDLNDHLGIGVEASNSVDNLSQFRVKCQENSVDVRLRLKRENGKICQFQLLLDPLVHEIIPEDTVPKLKGREGKRRLEVKLFKREKKTEWRGDIVKSQSKAKASTGKQDAKPNAQATMLNPLSAEEIAKLPRPGGSNSDNRPSSFLQDAGRDPREAPALLHKEEPSKKDDGHEQRKKDIKLEPPQRETVEEQPTNNAAPQTASFPSYGQAVQKPTAGKATALPPWVERVQERSLPSGGLEFDVHLGMEAGHGVGMEDLELDGDDAAGLRLSLRGVDEPLILATIKDTAALKAKWRRKTRVLELRLP